MARGINKVILVGNLGADPETRYTPSGTAITTIRVATSESWKDKQTGEQQERTEWHRVKFFGRLAEIAGEYLKKGSQVYVEGRCAPRNTKRTASSAGAPTSSPTKCRCSAAAAARAAAKAVAVASAANAVPRADRSRRPRAVRARRPQHQLRRTTASTMMRFRSEV